MATTSTDILLTQLRTRLLTYVPPTGTALSVRLGTRLYKDFAPDATAYPMGIMRLVNQFTDGAYNGERMEADLEIMLFTNTRSQAASLEDIADVALQAVTRYSNATSGLVFSRNAQRDTLPPGTDPADREIVQIRIVAHLTIWPLYLTSVAT